MPAFPCVDRGLSQAVDLQWYTAFQQRVTQQHIPAWAALLSLTDYSLRIGTATAWVEAGALPGELRHLGSWATKIGEEVYARMSAERQLALQQAATHSAGMSLDALLRAASEGEQTGRAVLLPGAAATAAASQPLSVQAPAQSEGPRVKRRRTGAAPQPTASTLHAHFTQKGAAP